MLAHFSTRCYRRPPERYGVGTRVTAEHKICEPTLDDRVQILEKKVAELAKLPAHVESLELQIVQLGGDMRAEFSAIRQGMSSESGWVRAEFAAVRQEFAAIRQEIRDGDEETRRYMRILHEEVLSRIASLGEGRNSA